MPARRLWPVLLALALSLAPAANVLADTAYTVRAGDTLYGIALRFGVTVQAIVAANNLLNPNLIYAGQLLTIPDGQPSGVPSGPPAPATQPPAAGGIYVVQRGDTLSRIAVRFGVTVAALVQANSLANPNVIYVGQSLTIPGGPAAPPAGGTAPAPSPAPPAATNLLPNPSFEGGSYDLYGAPELQVPNGWQMEIDEGWASPAGAIYWRPESRIVPRWGLPLMEQSLFVWDGDWAIKVFKGGAPISFRLYTDVALPAGTYRFTASYFPDLVAEYAANGEKIWAGQPLAGEVAFIHGAAGGWAPVAVGGRNTVDWTFTVEAPGTVRLGVAFRAREVLANNGFFLDAWSLQRVN
jgi:LysM repeat protein